MVKPTILSETPISMSIMKDHLEQIKKKEKELNFRSARTLEYLSSHATLDKKKADELYQKIEKLNIPRLKEIHMLKIVDLMPTSADEIKTILQAYTVTINNDNLKKIIDTVAEYQE